MALGTVTPSKVTTPAFNSCLSSQFALGILGEGGVPLVLQITSSYILKSTHCLHLICLRLCLFSSWVFELCMSKQCTLSKQLWSFYYHGTVSICNYFNQASFARTLATEYSQARAWEELGFAARKRGGGLPHDVFYYYGTGTVELLTTDTTGTTMVQARFFPITYLFTMAFLP